MNSFRLSRWDARVGTSVFPACNAAKREAKHKTLNLGGPQTLAVTVLGIA